MRLSEVEWDRAKDERESDAQREYLLAQAEQAHGKAAAEAQVAVAITRLEYLLA